jgi:hypothetical protein
MTAQTLHQLRTQLATLRATRAWQRTMVALCFAIAAALWLLGAIFVIDWMLQREMQSPQRIVVMILAAFAFVWLARKYAWPFLAVEETEIDLALQVEKHHQLESDLVAALQFERDPEGRLGSRVLEAAVVEGVAQAGIDVQAGFKPSPLPKYLSAAGLTALLVAILAIQYPGHLRAFLNRLGLGNEHYPSATRIAGFTLSGRAVTMDGLKPHDMRLAQGRAIEFLLRIEGAVPTQGHARLSNVVGGVHTELDLKPLTQQERGERLTAALQQVRDAQAGTDLDLAGEWFDTFAARVRLELPVAWQALETEIGTATAGRRATLLQRTLPQWEKLLSERLALADNIESPGALLVGTLPRLVEPVNYRLQVGDAYTDPAAISMIPLPVVEPKVTPTPPAYAAKILAAANVGRQSAVLAGSSIAVELNCTNHKSLKEAWVNVRSGDEFFRFDLKAMNEDRTAWKLATPNTPFQAVAQELRYEMQVTDDDGLHLETPIQGQVRLRADKPPVAFASTIHRVVLPTAKPKIQIRAGDDFGIRALSFEATVKRQAALTQRIAETNVKPVEDTVANPPEVAQVSLLAAGEVILPGELPLANKVELDLQKLKFNSGGPLQKGDRVEVVLVAEDYRGDSPGELFRSEPFALDISDEFGVASAVSEIDPQAEERINEIIKRQLGIGESP